MKPLAIIAAALCAAVSLASNAQVAEWQKRYNKMLGYASEGHVKGFLSYYHPTFFQKTKSGRKVTYMQMAAQFVAMTESAQRVHGSAKVLSVSQKGPLYVVTYTTQTLADLSMSDGRVHRFQMKQRGVDVWKRFGAAYKQIRATEQESVELLDGSVIARNGKSVKATAIGLAFPSVKRPMPPKVSKKPAAKKPAAKKPASKKPAAKKPVVPAVQKAAPKTVAPKASTPKKATPKKAPPKAPAKSAKSPVPGVKPSHPLFGRAPLKAAAKKASVPKKPVAKKSVAPKKPAVKKPAVKKPAPKAPVAKKPAVKKPVAQKPVAKKPVAKKPAVKKPAVKKPPAKPAAKKPAVKKPAAKKPAPKKPVAKKPAPKKPVVKKAAVKKPAPKKKGIVIYAPGG